MSVRAIGPVLGIASALWEIIYVAVQGRVGEYQGILWPALVICWVILYVVGSRR